MREFKRTPGQAAAPLDRHRARARAVLAARVREPDADLRRESDAVAERREAVAEARLQAPRLQIVRTVPVAVCRQAFTGSRCHTQHRLGPTSTVAATERPGVRPVCLAP